MAPMVDGAAAAAELHRDDAASIVGQRKRLCSRPSQTVAREDAENQTRRAASSPASKG
jgi:hypothetical protein